jgi:hypothetical protein
MRFATALSVGALSLVATAQADPLGEPSTQAQVDGELRMYNFNRNYDATTTPNSKAFSLAALLNMKTGNIEGFSLGTSLVTARSLGTQSHELAKVDASVMGPDNAISAVSQAYLEYRHDIVLFRGGYQYLTTPWMGQVDSRVIPASYKALMGMVTPTAGWNIIAIREFDWKSRTSDGFHPDNTYYPANYDNDSLYGVNGSLPKTARATDGTWALGSTYVRGGLKVQGWYYDFMQFAHLGYVDASELIHTGTGFAPVVGVQFVNETGSGDNVLVDSRTKLVGVAGTRVRSRAFGADLGLVFPHGRFDIFYNKLSQESDAIGHGALISPFTSAFAADPLYTTSMLRGLVEAGPGEAWKGKLAYDLFDNRLQLIASYAIYQTSERGVSHDLYGEVIYRLDNLVKGLAVRDRLERSVGGVGNLNPANLPLTSNRLMISYKF